jgi:hypothetical protein
MNIAQKLARLCSASDLPPANQSAASTDFTMTAVTLGSLRRIRAVRSLTAEAISALSDGALRTLE